MADVLRSCSKTACRWPAAASLSYRYATRQVWLLDLAPAPDPSLYDLCPHHADHLVVPKGWERVDDRTPETVMVEPSAFDRVAHAAGLRAAQESQTPPRPLVRSKPGGNRYAALVEELPRLAAESGIPGATSIRSGPPPEEATAHIEASVRAKAEADARADADHEPPQPPAESVVRPRVQHARSTPPVPSRDLAPVPPMATVSASEPDADPIPGQLAIPVDDVAGGHSAVVVPFDAGSRRRTPRG